MPCPMHPRLTARILAIPQLIKADPCKAINYQTVFNLCTLYDLEGGDAATRKRVLHHLAKIYATEDFDLSACKL